LSSLGGRSPNDALISRLGDAQRRIVNLAEKKGTRMNLSDATTTLAAAWLLTAAPVVAAVGAIERRPWLL